ncbi:MAG: type II secretion system F family protein [Phycisphaerae bacterium]|nr:type II secretion system F family protein [Phycisphaerae bacterium]
MPADADAPQIFRYEAQTAQGQALSGTLEAANADEARWKLTGLGLRLLELEPARAPGPGRPLRGEDFAAFNHQLAQLTSAGLPVERGLRLIARDLHSRRLARSVEQVAEDLEAGKPLSEAFAARASGFPPLYAAVMEAGVKSGNLSGILLNLGRHLELLSRLRRSLWQVCAYPLMVLVTFAAVMTFLGVWIVPVLRAELDAFVTEGVFETQMPRLSRVVFDLAEAMPLVLVGVAAVAIAGLLSWWLLGRAGGGPWLFDHVLLRLPLVGPVLRHNLVARWCDAASVAVAARLDLPASLDLASSAVGSPLLREDSQGLKVAHEVGEPLAGVQRLRLVPRTVATAIDLTAPGQDLSITFTTLSAMHARQAENRLGMAQAILKPVLLLLVGGGLSLMVAGIFLPFVRLLQTISKLS